MRSPAAPSTPRRHCPCQAQATVFKIPSVGVRACSVAPEGCSVTVFRCCALSFRCVKASPDSPRCVCESKVSAGQCTLKREGVTLRHHPITLLTQSTSLELAQFSGKQRNRTNSQTNPLRKGSDQRRPRRGSRAAEAACFGFESLRIHVIMCPLVLLGVPFIRVRRSHTAPLSFKPDQNLPVPEPEKPADCKDGIQLERDKSLNA